MKKIMLVILPCIICLYTMSCSQKLSKKKAKDKLESFLNIPVSNNIKVLDYEVSSDMSGFYSEEFTVHFTKIEFNKIFNQVKPTKVDFFDGKNEKIYGYSIHHNDTLLSATFYPKTNEIKYGYSEQ